jgi:hypothetical protein
MTKPCIILNGAAKSGKGIVVDHLQLALTETFALNPLTMDVISCKTKLYSLLCEFFCITPEEFFKVYNNRDTKELPHKGLQIRARAYNKFLEYKGVRERHPGHPDSSVALSPRDAMIYLSELVAKPHMGMGYFGEARAKMVEQSSADFVIDDSGAAFIDSEGKLRVDEILPLVASVGAENIMVIRIHREGCSFAQDSRRSFPDSIKDLGITVLDVYNNSSEQEYLEGVSKVIMGFVKSKLN